mmetsp:Transcript_11385/g.28836  ORF Transcript_11385/g.28836 Transcript_11385/m.28836 type:complete len:315 (+) Transcript_11385:1094-2038(+)
MVLAHHAVRRTSRQCGSLHRRKLSLRVGREAVEGHHHGDAKSARVLDVAHEVACPARCQLDILALVRVVESLTRDDGWAAAVHLQRTHRRNDHRAVWIDAAVPALDVAELLHSNVRAEASLGDDISVVAHSPERNLIRDDRAVSVRDVREGPCVHEHGRSLERLHERGVDRVLHHDGESAADAEVVRRHRVAASIRRHHHASESLAHVREAGRESKHSHDLARHGDVEAGHPLHALFGWVLTHGDFAQESVVRVQHAAPRHLLRVHVKSRERRSLLWCELVRVRLGYAELFQAAKHHRAEPAVAILVRGAQPVV